MLQVPIDKIVPLTAARDTLSKIIADVESGTPMYIFTKNGKPSVAVVSIDYLQKQMGPVQTTPAPTPTPEPVMPPPPPTNEPFDSTQGKPLPPIVQQPEPAFDPNKFSPNQPQAPQTTNLSFNPEPHTGADDGNFWGSVPSSTPIADQSPPQTPPPAPQAPSKPVDTIKPQQPAPPMPPATPQQPAQTEADDMDIG